MVDTIFALASGQPPAAVAIVRLSGPRAVLVGETLAGRKLNPRHFVFANIRNPITAEVLDQAIVVSFPGPGSFTGEDCVEFQIHGSRAVIAAVLTVLGEQQACRPAKAGEFTQRAFFNGKLDLTAAEGLADLIDSETELQRRQALSAMAGGLTAITAKWRAGLIETLALIEATIDFSDEGDAPEGISAETALGLRKIREDMLAALSDSDRFQSIRGGFDVVILGPPNAGKSTFINALARRDVALVSAQPGTTRDLVEARLNIGGAIVTFVDTAGIREGADALEKEGIRRATARGAVADKILWLEDNGSDEPIPCEIDESKLIRVLTKIDLGKPQLKERYNFQISARTGEGMPELLSALEAHFARARSTSEAGGISNSRQKFEVTRAVEAVSRALCVDLGYELVAEEIRTTLQALERLVGSVSPDDVLDEVFSRFCMGK